MCIISCCLKNIYYMSHNKWMYVCVKIINGKKVSFF